MEVHFKEEIDFLFYFWLIFVETHSENVIAMATKENLPFLFWFQNITYVFLEKVKKF